MEYLEKKLDLFLKLLEDKNVTLLKQKMLIYIIKGDFKSAFKIYYSIKNKDSITDNYYLLLEREISKKVKELYENQKYDEALALLDFETDNTVLLNQKMKIYILKDDLINAIEIYKTIINKNDYTFRIYQTLEYKVSDKVKKIKDDNPQEALFLLSHFPNNLILLSQKMNIYVRIKNFGEAIKIYNILKQNNIGIKNIEWFEIELSKEISSLRKQDRGLEALNLLDQINCSSNEVLNNQKFRLLYENERFEEAYSLAQNLDKENPLFKINYANFVILLNEKVELHLLKGEVEEAILLNSLISESILYEENNNDLVKNLFDKLYDGTLTIEEIDSSNLEDYKKETLKVAYYKKYNLNYDSNKLKKLKKKYIDNEIVMSIINKLLDYLKRNIKIFDLGFFDDLFIKDNTKLTRGVSNENKKF